MKSNEEFKSEVYGRFEQYKVEKAKKRRNIIRYGSITMSALIVAVAVASPTFFGVEGKQSAYYDGQSQTEAGNEVNVYSQKSGGVYNSSDENTGVYSLDETPNGSEENMTAGGEGTRIGTDALSTAAVSTTFDAANATELVTTACATATVTESTAGPSVTATESASYNTTSKIKIENIEDIEKRFIGMEVFANEESASSAESNAISAGVNVQKYYDLSGRGIKTCVALNFYGSLTVTEIYNDGKTLVITAHLADEVSESITKSMNIFIFDGDRDIVFNIKTEQNEKEDG
ncbi:MAG: hypothetical protein IKI51_01475 [Clostridia bacterium]|nr:hypothetical protein [Clostridia bacterium]